MKSTVLSLIAFLLISILPVSILTVQLRDGMTLDEKNFCLIFGILFCIAGIIILVAGTGTGLLTKQSKTTAGWIFLLISSAIALFILAIPPMEIYFGINMPFFTTNNHQFNFFGYEIPAEKQIGFMLMAAVLMMLPARTIHLSILKLTQKRPNFRNEDEFETDNEFAFNHMEFPSKSREFPLKKK